MNQHNTWMSSRWWYMLAMLVIASYSIIAIQLADHTPKFDDLNDVFGFFKQLALAQTLPEKIGAFFYPNNEHITAFNHLLYFIQQQILGEVQFYPLILLGHCIIIATALLLGLVIDSPRRPFYFTAMVVGYLNLYYWDSSFKAMTALSNQAVILFAVASFFSLLRWKNVWLAMTFAVLATFSQGNGILVWPIGLYILLSDTHWHQEKWRAIGGWITAFFVAAVAYYWAKKTYSMPLTLTTDMALARWQQQPTLPLLSLAAFLGSTIFSAINVVLAIILGSVTLGTFCFYIWRCKEQNRLILAIVFFLIASAITASMMRGLLAGDASGVLESRYKMYSIAFLILTLILLCEWTTNSRHRVVLSAMLLIGSLGIQSTSYRLIPAIQHQAAVFHESYLNWLEDGDFRRQAVYFIPMSDHFLFVAEHLAVFDFMQLAKDKVILHSLPAASKPICSSTPASAGHCPMAIRHRGNALFAVVDGKNPDLKDNQQPALPATITLCDEQANAVMEFVILETDIAPESPASQQHWLIPEAEIPAGNYRVLFQPALQPVCETQLNKKPRKVKIEMRTLFGD